MLNYTGVSGQDPAVGIDLDLLDVVHELGEVGGRGKFLAHFSQVKVNFFGL